MYRHAANDAARRGPPGDMVRTETQTSRMNIERWREAVAERTIYRYVLLTTATRSRCSHASVPRSTWSPWALIGLPCNRETTAVISSGVAETETTIPPGSVI